MLFSRASSASRWSASGRAVELEEGLDMGCDDAVVVVAGGAAAGVKSCGLGLELLVLKGDIMGGLNGSEGEGCTKASKMS